MENALNQKGAMYAEKILAMRKAFEIVKKRQKENASKIPDLEERLKRLKRVRKESVGNSNLINESVENLENNGLDVKFAKDGDDAIEILMKEVDGVVVKSKSNVSKEIGLIERLEKNGVKVIETDIGDRLLQLLNESSSHPTGPASHLTFNFITKKFREKFGVEISKPDELIEFLIKDIKKNIDIADVGLTGANAITAEGSILLLHNEGNIFEVLNRPKKWIILAGIDKFYPSVDEALNAAKIQSFYATGQPIPSFVEIISGVSKTADIEKRIYKGLHNPREVILILLDNNRSYLINNGFRELLYCIGCGNCVINCPSYRVFGEDFKGGRFALYSALYNGASDLTLCLSCGRCKKNCPLEIDIPGMIGSIRKGSKLYNLVYSHAKWLTRAIYLEILAMHLMLRDKLLKNF